jgi:hypothetical protein
MAPRPPIQAVIETQAELDEGRRNWRMVLFNEDGTPFLSEDGLLGPNTMAAQTDVDLTGLTDGDILVWDATTSKWIREAAPSGGPPIRTPGMLSVVRVSPRSVPVGRIQRLTCRATTRVHVRALRFVRSRALLLCVAS